MESMLSGNSLPQICVVSGKEYVENAAQIVVNIAQFPDTKGTSTLVTHLLIIELIKYPSVLLTRRALASIAGPAKVSNARAWSSRKRENFNRRLEGPGKRGRAGLDRKAGKKEEFPGTMENMLPANSFPQICVVSGNEYVENRDGMQVTEGWCL